MLHGLSVVLVRPRFPENIGMAARAMANMGADSLILIEPERFDRAKSDPLATTQGLAVLDSALVLPSLEEALKPFAAAFGTTARTGGLRRELRNPEEAAVEARSFARQGGRFAFVFGPEDRGLTNEEAALCTRLVTIPVSAEHSSLNLAQAVLVLLYECVKADMALPFSAEGKDRNWSRPARRADSRLASLEEEALLTETLQKLLVDIDHLPADNPEWFMQPMKRFLRKHKLRRHEFDMIMGICRQMRRHVK